MGKTVPRVGRGKGGHFTSLHFTPPPLYSTLLYATPLHLTLRHSTPLYTTPLYATLLTWFEELFQRLFDLLFIFISAATIIAPGE